MWSFSSKNVNLDEDERPYLLEIGNGKGCVCKIRLSDKDLEKCRENVFYLKQLIYNYALDLIEMYRQCDEKDTFYERDFYKQMIDSIKKGL